MDILQDKINEFNTVLLELPKEISIIETNMHRLVAEYEQILKNVQIYNTRDWSNLDYYTNVVQESYDNLFLSINQFYVEYGLITKSFIRNRNNIKITESNIRATNNLIEKYNVDILTNYKEFKRSVYALINNYKSFANMMLKYGITSVNPAPNQEMNVKYVETLRELKQILAGVANNTRKLRDIELFMLNNNYVDEIKNKITEMQAHNSNKTNVVDGDDKLINKITTMLDTSNSKLMKHYNDHVASVVDKLVEYSAAAKPNVEISDLLNKHLASVSQILSGKLITNSELATLSGEIEQLIEVTSKNNVSIKNAVNEQINALINSVSELLTKIDQLSGLTQNDLATISEQVQLIDAFIKKYESKEATHDTEALYNKMNKILADIHERLEEQTYQVVTKRRKVN